MPFRDAGRGRSDFNLSIQDCLWGFYKAMQNKLLDMNEFDVNDYEYYEKVENGDWNWLTPNFIAFASPVDPIWIRDEKEKKEQDSSQVPASPAKQSQHALQRKLPQPFNNCLNYFENANVQLVVRLNNPLYDRQVFLDRGIKHQELYFDDGTNPDDEIVRTFINMADEVVEAGGVVAVHVSSPVHHLLYVIDKCWCQCKAGLGRTGTLIGAYLIWKYGFTASEAIAFMRILRPGSVVGPQQQFMYAKQLEWCRWSAVDEMRRLQAETLVDLIPVAPATPPAEADEEMEIATDSTISPEKAVVSLKSMPVPPVTPSKHVAAATAKAGAMSPPGQPRKTPAGKRVASDSDSDLEDPNDVLPALQSVPAPVRRAKPKTPPTRTGVSRITSSEQRPTRTLRSHAPVRNRAAPVAKPVPAVTKATATKANGQAPHKIPRLANGATVRGATPAPVPSGPKDIEMSMPSVASVPSVPAHPHPSAQARAPTAARRLRQIPSPIPSRLPTLVGARRAQVIAGSGPSKIGTMGPPDAWTRKDAASIVTPGTKSEKPALRPVRRRRSSLSAVDIVA